MLTIFAIQIYIHISNKSLFFLVNFPTMDSHHWAIMKWNIEKFVLTIYFVLTFPQREKKLKMDSIHRAWVDPKLKTSDK